mgnify:CR=1 FL=1
MIRRPPRYKLFPYTTRFRSKLTLDIEDDDPPGLPQLSVTVIDGFANENGRDVAIVEFAREGNTTDPLEVSYEISGKAENNLDYVEIPSRFTFEAGQSKGMIVIRPIEDQYIEGIENIVLTVTADDTFLTAVPIKVEIDRKSVV